MSLNCKIPKDLSNFNDLLEKIYGVKLSCVNLNEKSNLDTLNRCIRQQNKDRQASYDDLGDVKKLLDSDLTKTTHKKDTTQEINFKKAMKEFQLKTKEENRKKTEERLAKMREDDKKFKEIMKNKNFFNDILKSN
jgi:septal ring factor EnvC (AmiA/AmiB activator)